MYVIFKKQTTDTEYGIKIISFVGGTFREYKESEEIIVDFIENISSLTFLQDDKFYVYESDNEEMFVLKKTDDNINRHNEVIMIDDKLYILNEI